MSISVLNDDTNSCDSWVHSVVYSCVKLCFIGYIDTDLLLGRYWFCPGKRHLFHAQFHTWTSTKPCLLCDSTCVFFQAGPNRSKVHFSGAELIRSDTIPADTLSEYGIIIGLRHMPFWLWIIMVHSWGERIKQLSRWAFRNELFPCTADRK